MVRHNIRVEIDPLTWPTLTADLTHEERCALLGLMMACALNGTGAVPDDDTALAALTGLGGRWADSRLRDRGVLARWFDLEDGRLYARDLVEEMARREEWLAKSRRGGAASAASRAARKATTPATKVPTLLATKVDQPLETAATPAPVPPTPAATETLARQGETAAEGAGAPPPNCTPPPAREEAAEPCQQAEEVLAQGAQTRPPQTPHIVLRSNTTASSASEEEENARCGGKRAGGEGGVGGGEGRPGDPGSAPVDLFGDPLPSPRPRRAHPRPSAADVEAATRLVGAYQREVRSWHRPGRRAAVNAAWWLSRGVTEAELLSAITNYAAAMDDGDVEYGYRLSAQNFFGTTDPKWRSYEKPVEGKKNHERPRGKSAAERWEDERREWLARCARELDGVG